MEPSQRKGLQGEEEQQGLLLQGCKVGDVQEGLNKGRLPLQRDRFPLAYCVSEKASSRKVSQ
jgi:hypothetical protein